MRFALLFLCNSSNDGMLLGGVRGTLGLSIDLGWKAGGSYSFLSVTNPLNCSIHTLVVLTVVSRRASKPPGPRLFPRSRFDVLLASSACFITAMSVVVFAFDGTCASDCLDCRDLLRDALAW